MDTLYTVGFREVLGLNSFKNFSNLTTGCEDIAYCLVGYFILSHPVDCDKIVLKFKFFVGFNVLRGALAMFVCLPAFFVFETFYRL